MEGSVEARRSIAFPYLIFQTFFSKQTSSVQTWSAAYMETAEACEWDGRLDWCDGGFASVIVRRGHFLLFLCRLVLMSTCTRSFCQRTRVSLTGVQLCSSISNKLYYNVLFKPIYQNQHYLLYYWSYSALQYLGQPSLPTWLSEPWLTTILSSAHHCFFFRQFLMDTD